VVTLDRGLLESLSDDREDDDGCSDTDLDGDDAAMNVRDIAEEEGGSNDAEEEEGSDDAEEEEGSDGAEEVDTA
jgi:hypothetical protein